ncbi:MAG: hypothetical protein IPM56_16245 [Ignavibacteriales bacterium]|nr:MAG: hypothetical protein IPM56_16245 [Ignavibacteriales bacterium]
MTPGIRQAWITSRNNLNAVNPNGRLAIGFNSDHQFVIEDKTQKDSRQRDLLIGTDFMFKGTSKQNTMADLLWFIQAWREGVAAQITSEKEGATYGAGTYNFDGEEFMGLEWKLREFTNERSLEITLQAQFEPAITTQLIQSAGTNVPRDLNALNLGHRGEDDTKYKAPFQGDVQSPVATPICNGEQVLNKEFLVENIVTRRHRNRATTTWIHFYLKLLLDKAANWDLISLYTKNRKASLLVSEKNSLSPASTNTYNFGDGVLFQKNKLSIDKDVRTQELIWEGYVSPADIAINTNTNTLTVTETV